METKDSGRDNWMDEEARSGHGIPAITDEDIDELLEVIDGHINALKEEVKKTEGGIGDLPGVMYVDIQHNWPLGHLRLLKAGILIGRGKSSTGRAQEIVEKIAKGEK